MLSLLGLSPAPVSPAKTTLVGGILGQTEEMLQSGRLGRGVSGAELVFNTHPNPLGSQLE